MLKVTHVRSDMKDHPQSRENTVQEAISIAFDVHLGWGGYVCELSGTRIVLSTPIFDFEDRCIIEGDAEEMSPLVIIVSFWVDCFSSGEVNNEIIESAINSQVVEKTRGNTLMLTSVIGLAVGKERLKKFTSYLESYR